MPTPVGIKGDKRDPLSLKLEVGIGSREFKAGQLGPTNAQAKAYQYLLDHEQRVFDRCVEAVISKGVPNLRVMIGPQVKPELLDTLLPHPMARDQFKERARFDLVSVIFDSKDGVAHIEYYLHFDWDTSMSLKVVMHMDRVVYVGLGGDGWRDR